MKKRVFAGTLLVFLLCLPASAVNADMLADAIASKMGEEPYVVRVLYGEMLLNRMDSTEFGDTLPEVSDGRIFWGIAKDSDRRAAAAALRRFGFAGGALYVAKWQDVENTPLMLRSGVRLYDWFFYI